MAAADVETMKQTWLRPPRQRRTIICAKCQWNLYEPLPCPLCDSADFDNGVKSSPAYRIPRVQRVDLPVQRLAALTELRKRPPLEQSFFQFDSPDDDHKESQPTERAQLVGVYNVGTVKQSKSGGGSVPVKRPGAVRFVCVSDTHGHHRELSLPDGDVLLHTGDITFTGRHHILEDFNSWLGEQKFEHKIVIAGNHDITLFPEFYEQHWWRFHPEYAVLPPPPRAIGLLSNCTYLCDSSTEVLGVRVYGSPWTPEYHHWAFMLKGETELRKAWARIPDRVDVLLTHGPPAGVRDIGRKGKSAGCAELLAAVKTKKPLVHVFGHIHESYGKYTGNPNTTFINAASLNRKYKANNKPIVFDVLPAK